MHAGLVLLCFCSATAQFVPYRQIALSTPHAVGAYDAFGTSVSVKGNAIAVGADVAGESSQGLVFTYARSAGSGIWEFDAQIEASDGVDGDRFGNSLSIFDEWLTVGAFLQDRSGKVYVFERNNNTDKRWRPHSELLPLVRVRDGYFGSRVVMKNYTLAVGHPAARVEQEDEAGNVNLFNRFGQHWVLGNVITPAAPQARSLHGFSTDFDRGNEQIIGAPHEGGNGYGYIYEYRGDRWAPVVRHPGTMGAKFGHDVAISGRHAAVSSREGGPTKNGYVVTFERIGEDWIPGDRIIVGAVSSTDAGTAYFGNSVEIDGDVMAIGSPFEGATGAVYVYHWMYNSTWVLQHKLLGPSSASNDYYHSMFGWSLSMFGGDTLVVGAPGSLTTSGVKRAGTVFVFDQFRFTQAPTVAPTSPAPSSSPTTTHSPTTNPTNAPSTNVASRLHASLLGLAVLTYIRQNVR